MTMSKQSAPSKTGILARWVGVQVAAKAVSLALGAPVVAATIMGALAYIEGLPLAWGFLAIIFSAAAAATLLNQTRSFMLAYSVANKLYTKGVEVHRAQDTAGRGGYVVGIEFHNSADIPLEYRVRRCSGHLQERVVVATDGGTASDGDVIEAQGRRTFYLGIVVMNSAKNKNMPGEAEITYVYGKPGKLNNEETEKFSIRVTTGEDGEVVGCNSFT